MGRRQHPPRASGAVLTAQEGLAELHGAFAGTREEAPGCLRQPTKNFRR